MFLTGGSRVKRRKISEAQLYRLFRKHRALNLEVWRRDSYIGRESQSRFRRLRWNRPTRYRMKSIERYSVSCYAEPNYDNHHRAPKTNLAHVEAMLRFDRSDAGLFVHTIGTTHGRVLWTAENGFMKGRKK